MNKNKQIQNHWMCFKVSTLTASITSLILISLPAQIQASDIDIYQAGGTGTTKIYMMLDRSGSMNQSDFMAQDYGNSYNERNWWGGTDRVNICSTDSNTKLIDTTLYNALKVGGYNYTIKDVDRYCAVDLSRTYNTDDAGFKVKIRKLCDFQSGTTYNCYSRMINLRKGLISLILDSTVDENIQLALGVYSGSSASDLKDFTVMNINNKVNFINSVQAIRASGTTPIATAYNVAGRKFLNQSSTSNTSESCTGNGIYFLTDGTPQGDNAAFNYNGLTPVTTKRLGSSSDSYWNNIGNYAQSIRAHNKKIKTATVGFGGGYLTSSDAIITQGDKKYFDCSKVGSANSNERNLCLWGSKTIPGGAGGEGGFGEGGFYTAQSADDLVASLKSFITETTVPIEGSTIGSSTIPVDALNTSQLQPFAYFPMFKPMIETQDQLWVGNLKKYNVIDGSLYDINKKAVFKNSTDFNTSLRDYWLNISAIHPDEVISYGGNLSQLLGTQLPKLDASSNLLLQRKVFMNSDSSSGALKSAESILKDGTLADREYLYGLLGYSKLTAADLTLLKNKSYADQLTYLKTKDAAKGYQLGSIIHSSPILLTQKGVIIDSNESVDRDDYVLFGTTQGVLHVVKSGTQNTQITNGSAVAEDSGTEVFSFVPKEMLDTQKAGFFESMAMSKDMGGFYYGVDGPWTVHTVYEPNFYNSTVAGATVERDGLQVKADSKLSHQYVYGGLRMGGRSYYALNLSDIAKPKLMFHIDPASATSGALSHMGESWSKPMLAYIKWNGQRKLVMIVGGGYDRQYEAPTFTNTTGNVKGNGVYIFDAENGKLLWWGSSNAANKDGIATGGAETTISDMVNSIPSRVKTVDRDGDGLVDHLYVGDLGGKVFRIDLNPNHKAADSKKKFVLNAFTFADAKEPNKNPPRFYEAPTFTMHTNPAGKKFAVVSMATGDRSSPLKSDSSAVDMILGFHDSGVTANTIVANATITLTGMNQIYATNASTTGTFGWYYKLPISSVGGKSYQARGLSEGIALDGDLYYSVFDPSKTNNGSDSSSTSCSGGIVGESKAVKLCLPSGVCDNKTSIEEVADLGAGIISLNVGPGKKKGSRTLIINDPNKILKDKDGNLIEYQTVSKILPTRWYDMTPYVGAK